MHGPIASRVETLDCAECGLKGLIIVIRCGWRVTESSGHTYSQLIIAQRICHIKWNFTFILCGCHKGVGRIVRSLHVLRCVNDGQSERWRSNEQSEWTREKIYQDRHFEVCHWLIVFRWLTKFWWNILHRFFFFLFFLFQIDVIMKKKQQVNYAEAALNIIHVLESLLFSFLGFVPICLTHS